MTTAAEVQTTQVYNIVIKATPEQIWEAITKPEFTARYFYGARIENGNGRHVAHGPNGELWGDDPLVEYAPPRRPRPSCRRPSTVADSDHGESSSATGVDRHPCQSLASARRSGE